MKPQLLVAALITVFSITVLSESNLLGRAGQANAPILRDQRSVDQNKRESAKERGERSDAPAWEDGGTPLTVVRSPHTCNAVVFSQMPGLPSFFVGRSADYLDGSSAKCVPNYPGARLHWLSLYRMDWSSNALHYVQDVLKPPFHISVDGSGGADVGNVFDASILSYKGELWAAFVCAGKGLPSNSSCMAPMNPASGVISDLQRLTVVVEGGPDSEKRFIYTASVPNLVAYHDHIYIYWSVIRMQAPGGFSNWKGITVRGMEVKQEEAGLRRFWGVGSGGAPVMTYDPTLTTEVLAPDPRDPTANQSVDIKGVFADGDYIYLPVSIGGRGPSNNQNCVKEPLRRFLI